MSELFDDDAKGRRFDGNPVDHAFVLPRQIGKVR
jgi:hypothetical protein